MKLLFKILIAIFSACAAQASANANKCNYEFKLTYRDFDPIWSEDPDMHPNKRAFYDQLKALISSEMAKKGYYSLPADTTTYNFRFALDLFKPIVQIKYETTSKIIENLLTFPDNLAYINGVPDYYPENTILHGTLSPIETSNFGDSIKKAVAELPSCADLKDKTESILNASIATLKAAIEHNKNHQNSLYQPIFDHYPIKPENYCIIERSKPRCSDEESRYYHATGVVSCRARVKFKLKGDPRTFEGQSRYFTGEVRDRVNYDAVSLVWNIPLLMVPSYVGAVVTGVMAKSKAKRLLEKNLAEFQTCGK